MKTKLTIALLALAGGIIFFANPIFAADSVTNSVSQTIEPPPLKIICSPEKSRVHLREVFKVKLEVKNVSNTNQSFTVMSCGWKDHLGSNNGQIKIWIHDICSANAPIKIELASGESWKKEFEMCILKPASANTLSFKLSFTPLPFDLVPPHFENGQTVWQENHETRVYWSDEVSININPRLVPDWISW